MLMRVARPNFDALCDGSKQLLIWALSRKRDFHSTHENNFFDKETHEHRGRDSEYRGLQRYFNQRESRRYEDRGPGYHRKSRPYNQGYGRRRQDEQFYAKGLEKPRLKLEDLVEKNSEFYKPHENVINRSEDEIKSFHEKNEIQFFGNLRCPPPIFSFKELGLSEEAMNVIRQLGYSQPTPIQSVTWPIALSGLNMFGSAQTGSGKTLAFALPGFIHVKNQPPRGDGDGPVALIVSPTRELAQQIQKVMLPFEGCFDLRVSCAFGGISKLSQVRLLQRSDICVATPGRIMDFLDEGATNLNRVTYFVLDEADRLLDMGFEPQIRAIMNQARPDSQVLMWSATWPKEVATLSRDFLKDHIGVKFGTWELTTNCNITQHVHVCEEYEKLGLLFKLLNQIKGEESKTLIFCQTKQRVEEISYRLKSKGFRARSLHGGMNQNIRDRTMELFRSGRVKILVGTAVVARGLDVNDIKYVISYDFPNVLEDYVHVIGRTGRNENKGTAHAFFTPENESMAHGLIELLKQSKQEINPELQEMSKKRLSFSSRPKIRW